MHFRFCLETAHLVIMVSMRFLPLIVVASLLYWLSPTPASAQQLQCNPCSYDFGSVEVGASGAYSVQLTNTGNKTVHVTAKAKYGHSFTFGSFPLPVKVRPGASILLPLNFTPNAEGQTNGVIRLVSDSPKRFAVNLSGTGVTASQAHLSVSPATLNFGNVTVGSSATLRATLTASKAAVTISSDGSSSSEFVIKGLALPLTLQPGKSVRLSIQFTPNASGTASAQAGFSSNAVNSPTVEQLTGTGVATGSHSVDLSWKESGGNAVGYNLYRGTSNGGPYSQINTALDASTTYTDSTVVAGTTYYYVATEVDAQGQESAYSNVGQAVIPNP
jgi:hypothetical protein